jgi:outer membrane protein assembly factor BamD (BamD/ComL family)
MHLYSTERLGLQPATGEKTLAQQAKEVYEQGVRFYNRKNYRSAIVRFERVRHMPGVTGREYMLYNIGIANLKLDRFATAIIYFENFLASPRITQADRTEAQKHLNEAKHKAGIPV